MKVERDSRKGLFKKSSFIWIYAQHKLNLIFMRIYLNWKSIKTVGPNKVRQYVVIKPRLRRENLYFRESNFHFQIV